MFSKKVYLCIIICFLVNALAMASAANRTITGVVISGEDNEPLIGAPVYVHPDELKKNGSSEVSLGTVTDIDGKFSLKAQKNDVIVVSFLGYKQEEYLVTKSESNISIILKQDSQVLEVTVIVGMGTQRKVSVVGAITNVDIADIQTPATNINNI